jgi:hypothetical protein
VAVEELDAGVLEFQGPPAPVDIAEKETKRRKD